MNEVNHYLATSLKNIRLKKGWSLDTASLNTGVSKTMLGQIERKESSPTVATLWKIATGFDISLSSLIEPKMDTSIQVEVRSANKLRQKPAQEDLLVATLFPYDDKFGFELLELTLKQGYEHYSEPHNVGVTEHITVIAGEMEVFIKNTWRKLTAGEAIRFAADESHGYRNLTNSVAVVHNLIHYKSK